MPARGHPPGRPQLPFACGPAARAPEPELVRRVVWGSSKPVPPVRAGGRRRKGGGTQTCKVFFLCTHCFFFFVNPRGPARSGRESRAPGPRKAAGAWRRPPGGRHAIRQCAGPARPVGPFCPPFAACAGPSRRPRADGCSNIRVSFSQCSNFLNLLILSTCESGL